MYDKIHYKKKKKNTTKKNPLEKPFGLGSIKFEYGQTLGDVTFVLFIKEKA